MWKVLLKCILISKTWKLHWSWSKVCFTWLCSLRGAWTNFKYLITIKISECIHKFYAYLNDRKGSENPFVTVLLGTYLCTQHTVGQMEPCNSHPHIHILRNLLYQKSCELGSESTADLGRRICRTRGHRLGIQKKVK